MLLQSCKKEVGFEPEIITLTEEEVSSDAERIRVRDETNTHLTLTSGGEEIRIPKQEIVSREQSPSAMPAMGDLLTRNQIRDLVEYISTLK